MRCEEKYQKKRIEEINMQRQLKVDEYYEKMRNEELNPRPINKEKEERIEELKERNIILNHKIKIANVKREQDLEKRGEKIIEDMKKKELITKRIFAEKQIIADKIKEENDERYMVVGCKYQQLEMDRKNKLDEKREELDDKRRAVNEFLREKQLIAQEARYISDQITYQRQKCGEQFDNMFSRRGLDEYAYMKVKGFISGDPRYKEICKFYENDNNKID
jgi:hypothetical protein